MSEDPKSDGVLCFHYSRMRIVNDTYHIPMPPALFVGTPVPRQKNVRRHTTQRGLLFFLAGLSGY